ncbi:MAG TPA: hypothetical protein VMV08_09340 [Gaiellaceae bacterium]|nr:hypothetical protein [Gaiellaceae bacterium]
MLRALAASAAVALAASATAGAITPSAALARSLKPSIQATYTKHKTGFLFTTVSCKIAASGATATCQAHFTAKAERALGVLRVAAKINRSTGAVSYQAVSLACTDSKTGAKITC